VTIRVGVDATGWANPRGFGRFTRNLTRELARRPGIVVELIVDEPSFSGGPAGAVANAVRPGRAQQSSPAGSRARRSLGDLLRAGATARRSPYDVILFPSPHTWFPARGVPSVLGVHDAIARTHPGLTFSSRSDRLAWNAKERLAIRAATRVFSVSLAARRDVAMAFGLAETAIAVVPEAADPVFHDPVADLAGELEPLGLVPGDYLLCAPGGISPHKSVPTAIAAHARLRAEGADVPRLAIVGALDGDPYVSAGADVRRALGEHSSGDSVVLTGFVPDGKLSALYRGAIAVVNTSLAEGFGLPAVEAAACGAAVVLTDIPAHRETLEGAGEFYPPGDDSALAAVLARLLRDDREAHAVGERCRTAAQPLTWEASAVALERVVRETVGDA